MAGRRGFPARSYIRAGDQMPTDGEWHWTPDKEYYWKGDTSSDEIVGHFFLFSVAYDLLPDAGLRQRIATTSARIMDHILRNQYTLVDLDGQPTRWGWWSSTPGLASATRRSGRAGTPCRVATPIASVCRRT